MGKTSAAYHRQWYQRNKQRRLELNAAYRNSRKEFLKQLKEGSACEVCGEDRTPCLDFHHTDPTTKEITIARVVSNGWSTKRIMEEVKKCKVLCANCHRWEHHNASVAPIG